MRHAKAEPFAATDHERLLTDRGRRCAAAAGLHLAATSNVPDHVVVSSAARAMATWEAVATAAGAAVEPQVDGAVYTGSPDVVLEALRSVPEDAEVVMFVGHNPTVAYLAHMLDDGHGDPEAVRQMLQGYPAGALAVLEVDGPWSDLRAESGRLVDFHVADG